jgi:hypothetical protein
VDEEETRCSHDPREDILPAFRMKNGTKVRSAVAFALACGNAQARAPQDASAPEDVALTIRADGTAAVREVRSAQLVAGENRVRIYDVSPRIAPETVTLRSLATPDLLELREQAVWFEVLDPERALERLAGRPVALFRWHDGVQEKLEGRLLFPPVVPGPKGEVRLPLYLEQSDGKIRLLDTAEVELDSLPPGDWNRTRVDWRVACKRPDRYRFELTYMTAGLSWRADASLRASAGGDTADVAVVATIKNDTGLAWRQARVGFVEADGFVADARRPDGERASALFHGFDDPVAIEPRRSVQVVLASAHDVPLVVAPTLFVRRDAPNGAVPVVRRFDVVNAPGKGLGRALPAATGRVLLVDPKNRPVPCGESELAGAGVNDVLSFVGPVEPGLAAHVQTAADEKRRMLTIDVANDRAEACTVDVLVALDPWEAVAQSTPPAAGVRAGLARFAVPIAANSRATASVVLSRP